MAGDDLAFLDKDYSVASDFNFAEDVGIQKDGSSAVTLSTNHIADKPPTHGIEPRGGLVEKDQLRLVNQRLSQSDALEHAFREIAQALFPMRSQPHQIEKSRNTFAEPRRSHSAEPSVESQEFGCCQPGVETKILRQKADFPADLHMVRGHSENECLTAAGLHKSQ